MARQLQLQLVVFLSCYVCLRWSLSTLLYVPGTTITCSCRQSYRYKYAKLAVEHDCNPWKVRAPVVRRASTSPATEEGPRVGIDDRTLGIAYGVLKQTLVPALEGAVLKATPEDFVVVEIPLTQEATFTPSVPDVPVPDDVRKPIVHKIPPREVVAEATQVWRERWPSSPHQAGGDPPEHEPARTLWNLSKGFDAVAAWLEGPAALRLQDWLLQVAERASFDAAEADKNGANDGVFLPPPPPPRELLLPCPADLDKAGRTELHGVFRAHMPYLKTRAIMPDSGGGRGGAISSIGSRTEGRISGLTYMEISHESTKRNSRQYWPQGRGEYLEFSVYKVGRSTHEAADAICRRLDVNRGRLSYAGAKDRRALTAQKMRCWRLPAEDIHEAQASGILASEGIAISDYRWVDEGFRLGQLEGNHFEVLLRPPPGGWGLRGAAEAAEAGVNGGVSAAVAFRRLRDEGFVNFFGAQRFGRDGANSVDVGMALLRCDWVGAVKKILAPHPADTREVVSAKEACFRRQGEDGGIPAALRLLPRGAFLERSLLTALAESGGKDPLGAILALPRPMRSLFVQAYQSLLWNEAASTRMGNGFDSPLARRKAVEGDLVIVAGGSPRTAWDTQPESVEGLESSGKPVPERRGSRGARGGGGRRGRGRRRRPTEDIGGASPDQQIITVSAEQALRGVFGIENVVIPLPGRSVSFPSNVVGDHMLASLERDGVDSVILEGHPQRAFDLQGAYRHISVHPRGLGVQPVALRDGDSGTQGEAELEIVHDQRSERDEGMSLPGTALWLRARFKDDISQRFRGPSSQNSDGVSNDGEGAPGMDSGATARAKTAIKVSFGLPRGSYATTLLQHLTGEGLGRTSAVKGDGDGEFDVG